MSAVQRIKHPHHILITGASSGLGAALAIAYSHDDAVIAITGRNAQRLEEVATSCRARGAHVMTGAIDVRDAGALKDFITAFDDAYPIDLAIANAGVSATTSGADSELERERAVFDINVNGVINTVHPLIERMSARGAGQIAIMSSLASFRHLPTAPAYSASKAAVRVYGEALRAQLKPRGITVSVICPGWVETPLTEKNTFKMPFIMPLEAAVQRIIRALSCGKGRIAFPKRLYFPFYFLTILSPRVTDFIFYENPAKPHRF